MGTIEDVSCNEHDRRLIINGESAYAANRLESLGTEDGKRLIVDEPKWLANLPV
jgi:hypothetical protein